MVTEGLNYNETAVYGVPNEYCYDSVSWPILLLVTLRSWHGLLTVINGELLTSGNKLKRSAELITAFWARRRRKLQKFPQIMLLHFIIYYTSK
jgi:hypothetical protein